MGAKILDGLRMAVESRSYIDAMHAVLTHAGWTSYPKPVLSGMTVTGFRFVVERSLSSELATAYNWIAENFLAADFVGVTSNQAAGFTFEPTFPLYQHQAVSDMKAAIDRGRGAVFWKDRFVVAAGYDDEAGVLWYSDGEGLDLCRLSYQEFGRNVSPYWHYQILDYPVDLDPIEIYKESLVQAVYKWETHDIMLPKEDYACGREAYDAIREALETRCYDPSQAAELFRCYAASKRDISEYMDTLTSLWPELGDAAEAYRVAAASFREALDLMEEQKGMMGKESGSSLIGRMEECRQSEQKAIDVIKIFMRERIGNRFDHVGQR
ncbi:hypothetical protein [Paenibacillus dokdonensis]|uniref:hypothetical protein n=1 Tax=Paenibacillus dokdonensis TaxID=2567944 RepID=UPI0010A889F7|nr:hypothetical protein [Paenibacillus dokdonensis]